MHELSIAGAILDASLRHAAGARVMHVHVRIGHLRQVVPEALSFAWEMVTLHTAAEGAELGLEAVQSEVRCAACGVVTAQAEFPLACRWCGGLAVEVVRGEELEIAWLEVETDDVATGAPPEPAAGIDRGGW